MYGKTPEKNTWLMSILASVAKVYSIDIQGESGNSVESIIAKLVTGLSQSHHALAASLVKTFARPMPTGQQEWMDNQRLTRLLHAMDLVQWREYDSPYVYTLREAFPHDISQPSALVDYERVRKIVVKPVREHVLKHILHAISIDATAEEICDACYRYFPWSSGGAHGWDVFLNGKSLNVRELRQYFARYPSAKISYIVNTKTYNSGKGQHWVAVEFRQGICRMICSQGGGFDTFRAVQADIDKGYIVAGGNKSKFVFDLQANGFGTAYNAQVLQHDTFNCGIYSFFAVYYLLCYDDIVKAVAAIGSNGENIAHGKLNIYDARIRLT
jgi:hypothetical protein